MPSHRSDSNSNDDAPPEIVFDPVPDPDDPVEQMIAAYRKGDKAAFRRAWKEAQARSDSLRRLCRLRAE